MYVVSAIYPSGRRILIGLANSKRDVDGLINDCIACNGEEKLKEMGIYFSVESII